MIATSMRLTSFLLVVFLAACAMTQGTRVDPDAFKKLVVGQTNIRDAIELLGRPYSEFTGQDGKPVILYIAVRSTPIGFTATGNPLYPLMGQARTESFVTALTFDENGLYLSAEGAP